MVISKIQFWGGGNISSDGPTPVLHYIDFFLRRIQQLLITKNYLKLEKIKKKKF